MERMNTETLRAADLLYQPVLTGACVSERGKGPLGMPITGEPSALATPAVRESWTGAGRSPGRRRNVQ